jgi:hypothetical protein
MKDEVVYCCQCFKWHQDKANPNIGLCYKKKHFVTAAYDTCDNPDPGKKV